MHRIQPLEASQVYVAWVKVFGQPGPDGVKSMESKQKGFKTKEAKEKTIWDEKDHIILGQGRYGSLLDSGAWRTGVSEDATGKAGSPNSCKKGVLWQRRS